jgi:heme A synthase
VSASSSIPRWLHRFALFIIAWAILLIWWGAAVTTENVGLAVPDWPLAFNRVNPDGWWGLLPLLLEHGHRWLATLLTGLVMVLFFGVVVADRRRLRLPGVREWPLSVSELIMVVLLSVALVVAVAFNQSPRVAPEGQVVWGWLAIGLGLLCLAWLGGSLAVRRWSLPVRLMSVIWVVIGIQAILGGTRVTALSDALGIFHGSLGQVLFCLLLTVGLVTSANWPQPRAIVEATRRQFLTMALVFLAAVVVQLTLGAGIRHTQRMIPAALDVVTTGGSFFPAAGRGDLWLIFAHKAWAMVVLILGSVLALQARRGLAAHPGIRRLALTVPVLLGCQVTLGISVLLTMDRFKLPPSTTLVQMKLSPVFWVTNLHVLTGLGILACAFTLVVKLIAAAPHRGRVTTQSGDSTGLPT